VAQVLVYAILNTGTTELAPSRRTEALASEPTGYAGHRVLLRDLVEQGSLKPVRMLLHLEPFGDDGPAKK